MDDFENRLWFKIFRQFSILLAIKTTIVVALCYSVGTYVSRCYHFSPPNVAGLWCIISGIIVLQVFIDESFSAAWLRILGSFVGATMSCIFSHFLGYTMQTLLLCVLCTVMLTSAFGIKQAFRLASLTASIVIVVGMLTPAVPPLMNASARFIESTMGALIAMAVTAIFFPLRKKMHLLNH